MTRTTLYISLVLSIFLVIATICGSLGVLIWFVKELSSVPIIGLGMILVPVPLAILLSAKIYQQIELIEHKPITVCKRYEITYDRKLPFDIRYQATVIVPGRPVIRIKEATLGSAKSKIRKLNSFSINT